MDKYDIFLGKNSVYDIVLSDPESADVFIKNLTYRMRLSVSHKTVAAQRLLRTLVKRCAQAVSTLRPSTLPIATTGTTYASVKNGTNTESDISFTSVSYTLASSSTGFTASIDTAIKYPAQIYELTEISVDEAPSVLTTYTGITQNASANTAVEDVIQENYTEVIDGVVAVSEAENVLTSMAGTPENRTLILTGELEITVS